MNLSVAIASTRRPQVLHDTVLSLDNQSRTPDEVILSVTGPDDYFPETASLPGIRVVTGPRGLPKQRNSAIQSIASDTAVILFLDDDVELHSEYLASCEQAFLEDPDIVALTGMVLEDGALKGEIPRATARARLVQHRLDHEPVRDGFLYGCNMAVRAGVAREVGFDERLSLYALLEDFDFGARCSRVGRVGFCPAAVMIHLATNAGRISVKRLGFAQVMNVYYLWRKGSLSNQSCVLMLRSYLLANLGGLVVVYKSRSRSERLRMLYGNLLACADIVRFGACPERILALEADRSGATAAGR